MGRLSESIDERICTSPCSDMSATRTRATPSGIRSSALTSATERHSRHRSLIAWHSGVRVPISARAVAVAEVDGPQVALDTVDGLDLDGYHVFHAVRADLLRRLGRTDEAIAAYDAAAVRTENAAERAYLLGRRDRLR